MLSSHYEVALVLPVLVVQDYYHLASCYVCHSLRYAVKQPQRLDLCLCQCGDSSPVGARCSCHGCAAHSPISYAVAALSSP